MFAKMLRNNIQYRVSLTNVDALNKDQFNLFTWVI